MINSVWGKTCSNKATYISKIQTCNTQCDATFDEKFSEMKTLTYLKEVVPPVNVQRESNAFFT